MEIIVHLILDEITDEFIHRNTSIGLHSERTEFDFRLTLKLRFFHVDGNGCNDSATNIGILIVLLIEFLDGSGDMLLERTLMRTTLNGVLTIHKRMIFLTILLVGMRKGNLDVVALQVDNRIKCLRIHRVGQEVLESISADNAATVIIDFQPRVEIGVIAKHRLHKFRLELIIQEQCIVGFKEDVSS